MWHIVQGVKIMKKCIDCKHFDNPDYVTSGYDLPYPRYVNGVERGHCEYIFEKKEQVVYGTWVTKETESNCHRFESGKNRWQIIFEMEQQ